MRMEHTATDLTSVLVSVFDSSAQLDPVRTHVEIVVRIAVDALGFSVREIARLIAKANTMLDLVRKALCDVATLWTRNRNADRPGTFGRPLSFTSFALSIARGRTVYLGAREGMDVKLLPTNGASPLFTQWTDRNCVPMRNKYLMAHNA